MQPHGTRQEMAVPDDARVVKQNVPFRAHARERAPYSEHDSLLGVASVLTQELRLRSLAALDSSSKVACSWLGTANGRHETPVLLVQFVHLALIGWGRFNTSKHDGLGNRLVVGTHHLILYFGRIAADALSIQRYTMPTVGGSVVLTSGAFGSQGAAVKGLHVG